MPRKARPAHPVPCAELFCACASARRIARLLTQLYDRHLKPSGIEATQFAMLAVLHFLPGSSQALIGRSLDMEKTTLSRNLKLLRQKGWIEPRAAKDGRERGFVLTSAGDDRLRAAQPAWKKAQDQLQSSMAPEEWDNMWKAFGAISRAVHQLDATPTHSKTILSKRKREDE